MTQKHYIAVAHILLDAQRPDGEGEEMRIGIARDLALMFKADNPRFKAPKFFDAAGCPQLTDTRQGLS